MDLFYLKKDSMFGQKSLFDPTNRETSPIFRERFLRADSARLRLAENLQDGACDVIASRFHRRVERNFLKKIPILKIPMLIIKGKNVNIEIRNLLLYNFTMIFFHILTP